MSYILDYVPVLRVGCPLVKHTRLACLTRPGWGGGGVGGMQWCLSVETTTSKSRWQMSNSSKLVSLTSL